MSAEKEKFYITTPIYYPSDALHIGHAYTTVAADAMTRYKKMRGYETYFLTGTDEHGQKIQRRAAEAGLEPQQFVDKIVEGVVRLWKVLNIEYDDFIRTTEPRHQVVAQQIFQRLYDKGDIYKAQYSGWYCTPCETLFTERQAGDEHICPDCGRPVELTTEESYFFKMSKYADRWLKFIEENPDFIQPVSRRNEMISFVKQGLEDLCVSRNTFSWGIPVPFDKSHVIYVWVDALTNYISALGYGTEDDAKYQKFWPADVHLMAKDIIRFHAIIWPIILMAAGIPLPKKVVAHGWLLMNDGKMSKSKGNVVDPIVLAERYGVDAIRYFLLREMPFGLDSNYSEEALVNRINIDLANDYGNLLSRTTSMIDKFCGGVVYAAEEATDFDAELVKVAQTVKQQVEEAMDKLDFSSALAAIWTLVNKGNKYIDDVAPWALNKARATAKLHTALYNMAEVIRLATIMVTPIMPDVPARVWEQLGISQLALAQTWDNLSWGAFPVGAKINRGAPLFPRIDLASLEKTEETAEPAAPAEPEFAPIAPEITIDDFAKIDLRVAKIIAVEKIPKADKLLKLQVVCAGEERTIVSGIAKHYEPADLIGKQVVLVANLKPVKLRGVMSHGMLLAASFDDQLAVLQVDGKIIPGGKVR